MRIETNFIDVDTKHINDYKFVRSRYSSPWIGVVVDEINRTNSKLYVMVVVKDRNGNKPRKRMVKYLDSRWTVDIDKFDISNLNKDWFKNIKSVKN